MAGLRGAGLEWDLLYLGRNRHGPDGPPVLSLPSPPTAGGGGGAGRVVVRAGFSTCAHGYAVSRRGLAKLLALPIRHAVRPPAARVKPVPRVPRAERLPRVEGSPPMSVFSVRSLYSTPLAQARAVATACMWRTARARVRACTCVGMLGVCTCVGARAYVVHMCTVRACACACGFACVGCARP
jgi:hypothetical protein